MLHFMLYLKGKTALLIFEQYLEMPSKFNRDFWLMSYYIATAGDIVEEAIEIVSESRKKRTFR